MTSNRSVSEMMERPDRTTVLKFLDHAFRNIDLPWLSPDDLGDIADGLRSYALDALSSQAQSDDVVERVRGEVLRIMDDHPFCRIPPSAVEEITRAALAAIPLAGAVEELREALVAHNEALQSAAACIARKGERTNWVGLHNAVQGVLIKYHGATNAARATLNEPLTKGASNAE